MSCEIKNGPAAHSLKGLKGQPSKWLERFSRLFPKNAKVLDLACGCGRNTKYLSKMGYEESDLTLLIFRVSPSSRLTLKTALGLSSQKLLT